MKALKVFKINVKGLSLLSYIGSWISLFVFTQIQWVFTHDYYDDLGLRLALALLVGWACSVVVYVFLFNIRNFLKGTSQDRAFVLAVSRQHWVFYLLLLFPFHLHPAFTLNNFLVPLTVLVYVAAALWWIVHNYQYLRRPVRGPFAWKQGWFSYVNAFQTETTRVRTWVKARGQGGYFGIYTFTWVMLGFHLFYFFCLARFPVYNARMLVAMLGHSLVSLILFINLVKLLSGGKKWASLVLTSGLGFLYIILYGYHLKIGLPFDLDLFLVNFSLLIHKESWYVIASFLQPEHAVLLGAVVILVVILEWKGRLLSQAPARVKPAHFIFTLLSLTALSLLPVKTTDEIMLLVRAIGRHFYTPASTSQSLFNKQYPYVSDSSFVLRKDQCREKPHVFIIFLESFNSQYIFRRVSGQREVTPAINALIPQGLYVEHFYGNSIQTSKGQFATLTGTFPSIRRKIFTSYPNLRFRSLPGMLKEYGYYTVFFKAYHDLSFDNTEYTARKMGYHDVLGMDDRFVTPAEKAASWGWGIEDSLYYVKFFQYLDTVSTLDQGQPVFATLTTITNHMMFNRTPLHKKILLSEANTIEENYLNTLYLTDAFLKEFFIQLKKRTRFENSLVVLVGDHSFPLGQHGYYHNEMSFYEEFFRTVLLMLWPGRLEPEFIRGRAYSQVDIAPTLLDLLGISTPNHFTGHSIFDPAHHSNVVPLVQPYSGIFLAAVRYPYKYVLNLSSYQEYLFDLSIDPGEKDNVISSFSHPGILAELKGTVEWIKAHEALIKSNRLWPPGK